MVETFEVWTQIWGYNGLCCTRMTMDQAVDEYKELVRKNPNKKYWVVKVSSDTKVIDNEELEVYIKGIPNKE